MPTALWSRPASSIRFRSRSSFGRRLSGRSRAGREPAVGRLGYPPQHDVGRRRPSRSGSAAAPAAGLMPACLTWSQRPSKSTSGSVQNRRIRATCSAQSPAAGVEVLAERLVLHEVPAAPDAKPEAAAAEHVHRRRLLGDQRRLSLRQDQHAGRQLDPLGRRREIAEEHEHLVEGALLGVGRPRPADVHPGEPRNWGTEHVIVGDQLLEPGPVDRLGVVPDRGWIVADLVCGNTTPSFIPAAPLSPRTADPRERQALPTYYEIWPRSPQCAFQVRINIRGRG